MSNRLAAETSPYLQQHADNPVDWYPWSEEALALARRDNRPILLSIGYSACHWCHVMAHESFEDAEVAAAMNRLFVNIKVDREERPDLDLIYQKAHQMLTGRPGGWPLTLFLAPDGAPFFGGTYFPKTPRYQLPGFVNLLEQIAAAFHGRRGEIDARNRLLLNALATGQAAETIQPTDFSAAPLRQATDRLAEQFDERWGGFGGTPKFPQPSILEFLLHDGSEAAWRMLTITLTRMAEGGIHDQLGGGFARYSVDQRWHIPHFEKMLYDNGPLLKVYAEAWVITGEAHYRRAAEGIADWVMRDMQAASGGYYSSRDADSEGEEGRYYVWTPDEVRTLLDDDEYAIAAAHWGLLQEPNFEGESRHPRWHPHVAVPLDEIARQRSMPLADCAALLDNARKKLLARREQRVPPRRDEKVLAGWNALMIEGMARAGRLLLRPDWIASARRALAFVRRDMWRNARLLATSRDGRAHLNAYLDDYAFLLAALLELLQADFVAEDLRFARELADVLLDAFEDRPAGGFYFTSHDHEQLIERPKPVYDNATPAGNGIAARALQRLTLLTGEARYAEAAERALAAHYTVLAADGSGSASLLLALDDWLVPPRLIVVRGPAELLGEWRSDNVLRCNVKDLLLFLPNETPDLPPLLDKPAGETVNAWVCAGVNCLPPATTPTSLRELLDRTGNVK